LAVAGKKQDTGYLGSRQPFFLSMTTHFFIDDAFFLSMTHFFYR